MRCCYECNNETVFHVENRQRVFNIKGDLFTLDTEVAVCEHCGQEIFDSEKDPGYQKQAFDMYRDAHHLLHPEEISAIRMKYALAIDKFSELIGFGKKTLWRYENGYIPEEAQNNLIALMDDPKNFKRIFSQNKDLLRKDEQEKVETILTSLLPDSTENCVTIKASSTWHKEGNLYYMPQTQIKSDWNVTMKEYALG